VEPLEAGLDSFPGYSIINAASVDVDELARM
jgi:hypothetical protein